MQAIWNDTVIEELQPFFSSIFDQDRTFSGNW